MTSRLPREVIRRPGRDPGRDPIGTNHVPFTPDVLNSGESSIAKIHSRGLSSVPLVVGPEHGQEHGQELLDFGRLS